MAIVIHVMDGSQDPNRQQNETHAGLLLSRDEELGWRAKLTAMPTQREIMRAVSDCPLAVAENILLWSKRLGWKIKLHPNSVSMKQLMKEVKSYTPSGNPDVVILAAAMLLKNFAPLEIQKQPGLPNLNGLLQRLQQQPQQKQVAQQQPAPTPAPAQQQAQQMPQYTGPGAEKMRRTQERYQQHMEQVNATVQANEVKREIGEKVAADLESELADIDELLNDSEMAFDEESGQEEEEVEEIVFKSKKEAIKWAIDSGAFENEADASETYDELKSETGVKTLKEFSPVWAETVETIIS